MSWFKPSSFEPEYKYELLGLFASLAIYNGVTIPFNFPKALYRKLLGLSSSLGDLADGWPQLAKGLEDLRDYDGDVEGTFMREYVFSTDVFGTTVNVDMSRSNSLGPQTMSSQLPPQNTTSRLYLRYQMMRSKRQAQAPAGMRMWTSDLGKQNDTQTTIATEEVDESIEKDSINKTPTTPSLPQPNMVDNQNRHQYIEDYINHLTNLSIAKQYDHFTRGFFRCITRKSICFFTPTQLKDLVEGSSKINTNRLRRFTIYEGGYHAKHPTILNFWRTVSKWPQEKFGRLLEFVTASDRLPIGGEERVNFVIQKNGEGNERLPTSLTCFGRLLLPEYDGIERMKQALELVVENAKGFGTP